MNESLRILTTHVVNAKNSIDRINNDFMQLANRIEHTKYLEEEPQTSDKGATDTESYRQSL